MSKFFSRYYWRVGFASHLYDLLTPLAYRQSIETTVQRASMGKGEIWLDAGCGSGQLLEAIHRRGFKDFTYLGMDIQMTGLIALSKKSRATNPGHRMSLFQATMTDPLPLKENSVDGIVAHFSVYTIKDAALRAELMRQFRRILKPGGTLVVVNPSETYDARQIVEDSLVQTREGGAFGKYALRKWILYPLTYSFGLRFIQRQIRRGQWCGYSLEGLCDEVLQGGFRVKSTETVYAGSAYLVVAG